ncbi:MAG: XdhC family protein [Dehalococcoidia bacterium]|jgi:hypothetical protein
MTDLVEIILDLLKQGEDIVVGRAISVKGSSPREIGATMLIRRSGKSPEQSAVDLLKLPFKKKPVSYSQTGNLQRFYLI